MDLTIAFTLFIGALSFGASGCLIGCMPILSPVIASVALKDKSARRWLFGLAAGRIFGYSSIAVLSYLGLAYVKSVLGKEEYISKFFGAFVFLVASFLLVQVFYPLAQKCGAKIFANISPFGVGVGLSLSFCPAVLQLISLAGAVDNILFAVFCGIVFGVGVSVVPTLFYGFALYPLIKNGVTELLRYKKALEIASALLLAVAGAAIFFGLLKV